ncbi:MAG TPA: GxxExxY protein [Pyrinomonadaceae bacterium]|nr:GxxExxY protein [Pyrinomonadaceae bacterium]
MNTGPHNGDIFTLCDVIRETSFDIYKYLRSGHKEQIYENALAHRLRKLGISLEQQQEVKVFDEDGTCLGLLKADLLVENKLICEIKGVRGLVDEHVAQLLGYLRASRIEHGLLINFGGPRLEIKKYILTPD